MQLHEIFEGDDVFLLFFLFTRALTVIAFLAEVVVFCLVVLMMMMKPIGIGPLGEILELLLLP